MNEITLILGIGIPLFVALMWLGWCVFQAGCAIRDGLYSIARRK